MNAWSVASTNRAARHGAGLAIWLISLTICAVFSPWAAHGQMHGTKDRKGSPEAGLAQWPAANGAGSAQSGGPASNPAREPASGEGWQITTVETDTLMYVQVSLALDQEGRAHIGYFDYDTYDVKCAFQGDTGWHSEIVEGQLNFFSGYPSLALDAAGNAHMAYCDGRIDELKYAHRDAGGWHTETVDDNGWFSGTSIGLSDNGQVHIGFWSGDPAPEALKHAYRDAAGWHTAIIDRFGDPNSYVSLVVDSAGGPYVSYYDRDARDLLYAYRAAAGWRVERVASAGDWARSTSLVLDRDNHPHISFHDSSGDVLRYARRDTAGWHLETADGQGRVGEYSSLALDGSGYPHISYYDLDAQALKYAYLDGAGWHVTTVDDEGATGKFTSLALDGGERPHIAYWDETNKRLRYAVYGAGPATTATPTASQTPTRTAAATHTVSPTSTATRMPGHLEHVYLPSVLRMPTPTELPAATMTATTFPTRTPTVGPPPDCDVSCGADTTGWWMALACESGAASSQQTSYQFWDPTRGLVTRYSIDRTYAESGRSYHISADYWRVSSGGVLVGRIALDVTGGGWAGAQHCQNY